MFPPFDLGTTWNICQGYNGPATHTGAYLYALDLTGSGCDNSAAGRHVNAPISGTLAYSYASDASHGNLCVNIAGNRSYTLTHVELANGFSGNSGSTVTAGQWIGTVAAAGNRGNNNLAHLHFQIWNAPGCYNSSVVPFDAAHGARICGAPDLTATGPNGGNGIWSGTSFTAQACGTPLPAPSGRRSDFNGDGRDDIAWHQGTSTLFMLSSNGTGFDLAGRNADDAPIGVPDWAAAGNIDGVGAAEIYWYHAAARTIYVLRWTGTTWIGVSASYGYDTPDHAVVGDFNGDGRDDIAWHQNTTLFLLTSNGTDFDLAGRNPTDAPIGTPDWAGAGNVDGAGPDEVYWHDVSSNIYTFRWNGSTWVPVTVSGGFGTPNLAIVGDYNGDGRDDIAWHQGPSTLFMLDSTGGGFGVAGRNDSIGIADRAGGGNIDGVGADEVYWYHSGPRNIYVLRWSGSTWYGVSATNGYDLSDHMVSAS